VTRSISYAPYVTSLPWITHFGCAYVVHGDDITSDSGGEDCYRFVKAAGRFKVVKRTPSISTTDLVGRMLLCTRTHFVRSLERVLEGQEGPGTDADRAAEGKAMMDRMRLYATDETARAPGADVWFWGAGVGAEAKTEDGAEEKGRWRKLIEGPRPKIGQRVVYVDGGFDLFSSGHIEFLRKVVEGEEKLARKNGWYERQLKDDISGKPYGPAFVVVGIHDDEVINHWKGVNYPIMNIYERGLCVLQCKVSGRISSRLEVETNTC
jgi:ethanolamine-phosphate cytidylyltransferase